MALCRTGARLFLEIMMTEFPGAYIQALMTDVLLLLQFIDMVNITS